MALSLGIVFGLIAMIGYGISNAISKVPAKILGSRKTVFFRNLMTSLILFIALLFFIKETVFSLEYIIIAIIISIIGYIPLVSFFQAVKHGKVGIVTPIANASIIFTVLFSIIFFKETLSQIQIFSIILIIAGIILISMDIKDWKNSELFNLKSGIPFALLAAFFWGIVFFLFKIPVLVLGAFLTAFLVEFGIAVSSYLHLKSSKIKITIPDKKMYPYLLVLGVLGAIALVSYNFGVKNYNVSVVAAITFANPVVATLYGKFVYKEKLSIMQYIAGLLIILGIVSLAYF